MYIPAPFEIKEIETIHQIVRENSFGILVSWNGEHSVATHLPFLLESQEGNDVLRGHMAKANPHARLLEGAALCIFPGPHGYVSPSWYETRPRVPTWNYISVHAYGRLEIVDEPDAVMEHLCKMVDTFDPHLSETHPESTDIELLKAHLGGLTAFRMRVERWEAKAKLNQNRLEKDRLGVKAHYEAAGSEQEQYMARFMQKAKSR
jgi:transcriptional regulator